MIYLLDTNVCIAAMRGHDHVRKNMRAHAPHDCAISTVSIYELYSGVERCRQPETERMKVESFFRPLHLLPFDEEAAVTTARIRWSLEKQGQPIGSYDLMLAGQALTLDLILITDNTKEFQRVPELRLENWQSC
jgi:tRNA(fMet)-specific endonuclease VapC